MIHEQRETINLLKELNEQHEAYNNLLAVNSELLSALLLITDHFPESVIRDQMGEFAQDVFNTINNAKKSNS